MPVKVVPLSELLPRRSKINQTSEWADLAQLFAKGLPKDSGITITFSPETIQLFKNDVQKAALAFVMRLRNDYSEKYTIRLVNKSEIQISNRKEK